MVKSLDKSGQKSGQNRKFVEKSSKFAHKSGLGHFLTNQKWAEKIEKIYYNEENGLKRGIFGLFL